MYVEQCAKFKSLVEVEAHRMVDDAVEKCMAKNAWAREATF